LCSISLHEAVLATRASERQAATFILVLQDEGLLCCDGARR